MDRHTLPEMYFSVDVEANGPIPGEYSMTSLGSTVVGRPDLTFYVELKPITPNIDPQAEAVGGLTLDYLAASGVDPGEAMRRFCEWVTHTAGSEHRPVFVALNATFDWMFVHWYLMKFVGENPFSIGGLDVKAYYMGMAGVAWGETTSAHISRRFGSGDEGTHHALEDAQLQARLFERMLAARAAHAEREKPSTSAG